MTSQYDIIKRQLLRKGRLFEDPEFPASSRSLDNSDGSSSHRDIKWLRPKKITRSPTFILGRKSRTDLQQGEIGDCWFVSGVACLAAFSPKLLEAVVPKGQTFDDGDYAGIFRFVFWEFDSWTEVIIDDRLPTRYDRPIYCHNRTGGETHEFWGALLEKAYAKFKGGYTNISGGHINDALVDLTGGISELFELSKDRDNLEPVLFDLMRRMSLMTSMMGCSIPSSRLAETAMSNGLYDGHAYAITKVTKLTLDGREVKLLRLRNPWGRSEWSGAWGDRSSEWRSISDETKRALQLETKNDGEFWMEYKDWIREFVNLDICHLGPDAHSQEVAEDLETIEWAQHMNHGAWIRGINAGGCGNAPDQALFWTNPQFAITLSEADDVNADGKCTTVISLMQKPRDMTRDELYISFYAYKLKDGSRKLLDGQNYDKKALFLAEKPGIYKNLREVSSHFRLEPGTYVIIPTTFYPNKEAEFFMRVYTEKASTVEVVDEPTVVDEKPEEEKDNNLALFEHHSGGDRRMDAAELRMLLNDVFREDISGEGFTVDAARSLILMMDKDKSGLIDYEEFRRMQKELKVWKQAFSRFDKNDTGDIDTYELSDIFKAIGFTLSRGVISSIVKRYGGKKRRLNFQDFLQCCTRIVVLYGFFKRNASKTSDPNTIELNLEEWLSTTMLY